jgi:hypothetical protein
MSSSKRQTVEKIAYGEEPEFTEQEYSQSQFISFLNFYNYNSNHDDFKAFTLEYVTENCSALHPLIRDIPKTLFKATLGSLCRMLTRGYPKSDYIYDSINKQICELIDYVGEREQHKAPAVEKPKPKPKNNVDTYIDDVEMYVDNCITTGNFVPKDWSKFIIQNKIKKDDGEKVADHFKHLLNELRESNEGYDLAKKDFDKYLGIVQSIVDVFGNILVHRVTRQRAPKPIDKNKLAAKVKYLPEYPELGLVSKSPIDIIGAKYVLLYNTKYKKLQLIVAETELTIRGSTIFGIDKLTSQSKTVRQPAIISEKFLIDDIPYLMGSFRLLKTKTAVPTGALNDHTVIILAMSATDIPKHKVVQF